MAIGEQIVMNAQTHFGTNMNLRQTQKLIQGVSYSPISGIFQRNNTVIGMAAIDFIKDCGDAAHTDELDAMAESFNRCDMAVAIFRSKKRNFKHLLQSPGAADQFSIDGPDR